MLFSIPKCAFHQFEDFTCVSQLFSNWECFRENEIRTLKKLMISNQIKWTLTYYSLEKKITHAKMRAARMDKQTIYLSRRRSLYLQWNHKKKKYNLILAFVLNQTRLNVFNCCFSFGISFKHWNIWNIFSSWSNGFNFCSRIPKAKVEKRDICVNNNYIYQFVRFFFVDEMPWWACSS